jgi:outer membrane protein OmpA-like peptidoglycan-associated protein
MKKPIALRNVFFESGSSDLKPESASELDRLAELLDKNPLLKIQINGHTDNVGNDESNMVLSEKRAKAVYDYLVTRQINLQRLRFKGYGETKPIDSNDTPEGRSRNRRTEFEVW